MPESHDGTECKLRHPQQTVEYEEEHRLNVSLFYKIAADMIIALSSSSSQKHQVLLTQNKATDLYDYSNYIIRRHSLVSLCTILC